MRGPAGWASRAAWYRRSRARDQSALRLRIRELAHARPGFGYLRIWVMRRREGWAFGVLGVRITFTPIGTKPASLRYEEGYNSVAVFTTRLGLNDIILLE